MLSKCPKCEQHISSYDIKDIEGNVNKVPTWRSVAYVCPFEECQTILSVAIDPIALKSDIIEEVVKKLKGI